MANKRLWFYVRGKESEEIFLTLNLSSAWLFLLALREFSYIYSIPSIFLTTLITGLQIIHLFLFFREDGYKIMKLYILLGCLLVLVLYNSATLATFNIVLAVILLKNENLTKISTVLFFGMAVGFLSYYILLDLGKVTDVIHRMPKGIGHTYGFENTNILPSKLFKFSLVLSIFFISNFNLKKVSILLIIPNYLLYLYCLSRTSYFSVLLYIFLLFFTFFANNFFYKFRRLLALLSFILFFTTLFLCLNYKDFPLLDILLTTRLSKNGYFLSNLSIINVFLGFKIPEGPMDSAYLAQFFAGGIISLLFFLNITKKGILNMNEYEFGLYVPLIITILIAGFAENTFSSFSVTTILFYKILVANIDLNYIEKRG